MALLRIAYKLILLAVHVATGVVLCVLFLYRGPTTPFRKNIVRWWLHITGIVLGLRIEVHGNSAPAPVYLIANHVSWLDVIVLGGLQHVTFLSKSEVMRWPVIGYLARKSGTLFIKRGSGMQSATQALSRCLQEQSSVVLFPEGTTSNGEEVRRFFPRLFAAAIENRSTVQPVALAYPSPYPDHKVHPAVPLHSSPHFFAAVIAVMKQPFIRVSVRYAQPVPATDDRNSLTNQVHTLVSQQLEQAYLEPESR